MPSLMRVLRVFLRRHRALRFSPEQRSFSSRPHSCPWVQTTDTLAREVMRLHVEARTARLIKRTSTLSNSKSSLRGAAALNCRQQARHAARNPCSRTTPTSPAHAILPALYRRPFLQRPRQ